MICHHHRESYLALVDACWENRAFGDFWQHYLVAEGVIDLAGDTGTALSSHALLHDATHGLSTGTGKPQRDFRHVGDRASHL